ncbi:MAG: ABC transporter ATP-binding protein [Oscillospiraceae bacterium]|nr:ABC transporter ATP-binding protein [Oscillospiraceae bacterium]
MAIIEVNNLTKDYGHRRGVFDVSLQVEKGEVFGFLGPNGAGKTTTIRHLMGFSAPQKGTTTIGGLDSWKHSAKILENVGYLPGEPAIPENLTGTQFIRMMQGLRNSHDEARLKHLLDLFALDPRGKTKRMSLGSKRKLAVITAFMADPDILLLDEPTSGLDPVMQERFIEFMREEKKRGKTILLSSHIFSEVDAVCDRIAIIKDGEIVSTVKTADIRHNENKTYEILFKNGTSETVNINDSEVNGLLKRLANSEVASFKEEKFTLEKHFLHFYEKGA